MLVGLGVLAEMQFLCNTQILSWLQLISFGGGSGNVALMLGRF
jgi:hypothetical protein